LQKIKIFKLLIKILMILIIKNKLRQFNLIVRIPKLNIFIRKILNKITKSKNLILISNYLKN